MIFFLLHVYMHTMCMSSACSDQKRVLGPLEVEVWKVVSHQVGAGKQTFSVKAISAINY